MPRNSRRPSSIDAAQQIDLPFDAKSSLQSTVEAENENQLLKDINDMNLNDLALRMQEENRYSKSKAHQDTMKKLSNPVDYLGNEVPQAERGTFYVEMESPHSTLKSSVDLSRLDPGARTNGVCCPSLRKNAGPPENKKGVKQDGGDCIIF